MLQYSKILLDKSLHISLTFHLYFDLQSQNKIAVSFPVEQVKINFTKLNKIYEVMLFKTVNIFSEDFTSQNYIIFCF